MDASSSSPKRRKLGNNQSSPPSTPPPQSIRIKQEDSEPPLPQRRVVTSGSRRYLIPNDCEKGQLNFKHNRQMWSKREADILRRRGCKPVRMFIREDGMVIDWESSVPVWSDTLQPAGTDLASVIQRAHAANDQSKSSSKKGASPNSQSGKPISPAVTPPSRKQLPQPPRPPPSGARVTDVSTSSAQNVSLPSPTSSIHGHQRLTEDPVNRSPHSVSDSGHGNESAPCHLGSEVAMASTETSLAPRQAQKSAEAESLPDTEVDELHAAAIEFLTHYIKVFDEDRSDLASAYSRNALFSCRVHELASATSPTPSKSDTFAPKPSSRDTLSSHDSLGVKQNRLEIVTSLLSLSSSYKFFALGNANVEYDFAYLHPTDDVLLICYAEIVDTRKAHKLSLDQSFILRKKENDEEDRLSERLWPLVAVSHQMTIRDLSQLSLQRTGGANA